MSSQRHFFSDAREAFDFLVSELGFRVIEPKTDSSLESVRFEKAPLSVEVGWYKGEVDVGLHVAIDTTILRPYRRKRFGLSEVLVHLQPGIFQTIPRLPESSTTLADARVYLACFAKLMRAHCAEILRGDLKTLEQIVSRDLKQC